MQHLSGSCRHLDTHSPPPQRVTVSYLREKHIGRAKYYVKVYLKGNTRNFIDWIFLDQTKWLDVDVISICF